MLYHLTCCQLSNHFFVFDAMHDVCHFDERAYGFNSFLKFSGAYFNAYEVLILYMRSEYQMLQTLAGKEGLMHEFCT